MIFTDFDDDSYLKNKFIEKTFHHGFKVFVLFQKSKYQVS